MRDRMLSQMDVGPLNLRRGNTKTRNQKFLTHHGRGYLKKCEALFPPAILTFLAPLGFGVYKFLSIRFSGYVTLSSMLESSFALPPTTAGGADGGVRAGVKLRQVRERLGLTLRAVEEASLEISAAEGNAEYMVSIGRLNQIENGGSLPSIYKLYTLAVIYHMSLEEIVSLYAIPVTKMEDYRVRLSPRRTHLVSVALAGTSRTLHFPVRFDPGFRPEKTIFLSRLIQEWGEIPIALLAKLDLKKFRYGYIGLEDHMMGPLLRPGAIVQIDDARRRVVNQGWTTEEDRPIYFVELRYSYECCWCYQRGRELALIPHPLSVCAPRTIRIPYEGEVLGQVVGVAMRLVQ